MSSRPYDSDAELFSLIRAELFTCVVGDVMDKLGLLTQYLPPEIQPLAPDMIIAGRAMTVLETNYLESAGSRTDVGARPFGLMFAALDDLKTGEVYIASGSGATYAMWGEIMSMRAQKLGAAGAVLQGYSRDTRGILSLGFPTFSAGAYGQDQAPRGKVIDFRVDVQIGQARISSGDIVFGDVDGVLIIPKAAEHEVIHRALEKVRGEHRVAEAVRAGMSATEAFERFGIM